MSEFKVGDEVVLLERVGGFLKGDLGVVTGVGYKSYEVTGDKDDMWYVRSHEIRHKRLGDCTAAEWDDVTHDTMQGDLERSSRGWWSDAVPNMLPDKVDEYDVVFHPTHYNQGGVECIDYIEQQLTAEQYVGYLAGNAMKYQHRWQYKNGVEDLEKAGWYSKRLTDFLKEMK